MFRPLILAAGLACAAMPVTAQPIAGSYLAGRAAQMNDDFGAMARYLSEALTTDPQNLAIMEALTGAYMSLLEFDRADTVASELVEAGGNSQIAALALLSADAGAGAWSDLLNDLDSGVTVGPLYDGLMRGWALLGLDRPEDALAAFDGVAEDQGVEAFGVYHKALAQAALGRFEDAAATLDAHDELRLTRRGMKAQAEILSQVGRFDEARTLLQEETGSNLDATLEATFDALADGTPLPFSVAPDARAGAAEVAFDIANTVVGETAASYALLYSRIAEYLRPAHVEARLLSAILLEDIGQYDLAIDAYDSIPTDAPAYISAELGRAEVMREAGRTDAGIEAVESLAKAFPEEQIVHIALGDALREEARFAEARAAYDTAIELTQTGGAVPWVVYFARAITAERLGDWDAAESDFRQALELSPDQPQVLNYLGYSLVERQERLDEALSMIERAVDAAPNSGAITDSLGWALYRLGRYSEAVAPMERAVELMPVDPVVNDHLGDVLWAVGRELEARFQWQRALSFVDNDTADEVDPDRIRRKLEVGLDAVLEEEGAPPLRMADGG
ncbi:tetratricopeptide repeat protein [Palleronia abyssalis]|uniref:Beta-barrel assembly-enhancing protease n=1 Tax=Palleronia abyssalis TaxID=1501240 RepID=A0A2R8BTQ0_9RHOB|nr:tetratricopeptide repeat protein [Palleronia abyssalis]SPJ23557.1 Beta-barrel assembly-enhancing protease [Palleronia abyssalis]